MTKKSHKRKNDGLQTVFESYESLVEEWGILESTASQDAASEARRFESIKSKG